MLKFVDTIRITAIILPMEEEEEERRRCFFRLNTFLHIKHIELVITVLNKSLTQSHKTAEFQFTSDKIFRERVFFFVPLLFFPIFPFNLQKTNAICKLRKEASNMFGMVHI